MVRLKTAISTALREKRAARASEGRVSGQDNAEAEKGGRKQTEPGEYVLVTCGGGDLLAEELPMEGLAARAMPSSEKTRPRSGP